VRISNIRLGELKPGRWRNLTDAELAGLLPGRKEW
jgi:23S rRNA pseudouridine2604 synthase